MILMLQFHDIFAKGRHEWIHNWKHIWLNSKSHNKYIVWQTSQGCGVNVHSRQYLSRSLNLNRTTSTALSAKWIPNPLTINVRPGQFVLILTLATNCTSRAHEATNSTQWPMFLTSLSSRLSILYLQATGYLTKDNDKQMLHDSLIAAYGWTKGSPPWFR